ncbi:RHS repeat-associated core domain-containing protein [Psychrobium sp. nBUS_13]|uniref:RHS repeat-associated core domain-containing protein n=1 Tax=Psychrobium sp. nBUS_13 TaxID=3395319 RepID=UPI003EBECF53
MQARYYDPVIGRFYSNDPVGFRDVHSFNRYVYANNNPYKYTDPTGKVAVCFTPVTAPICVGAVEAAVNGIGALILGGIVIYDELTDDEDDEICTGTFGCSGSNKGKKGKELRGGKKKDRDQWGKYSGKKHKKFQKWWEKEKQKDGSLHDLETDEERDEAYEDYLNDQENRNDQEQRRDDSYE